MATTEFVGFDGPV
ncbi:hypothetical protein EYZ11_008857 [Aspergillus tanneri]|uniref:Uncharacterized protein n=1 Tax=Aspergillus tanneri TaxID=1220188 RepID=A0A4S3J9H0_9EURO|nr:hypothetical protein EYZ11_008857 [Aspergillus tanneri]